MGQALNLSTGIWGRADYDLSGHHEHENKTFASPNFRLGGTSGFACQFQLPNHQFRGQEPGGLTPIEKAPRQGHGRSVTP